MPTDDQIEEIQKRLAKGLPWQRGWYIQQAFPLQEACKDIDRLLTLYHQQRERIATLEQTIKREGIEAQERTNRMTNNMLETRGDLATAMAQLEQLKQERNELSEEMESCHAMLDLHYAEDPESCSADTLEKRVQVHLTEVNAMRAEVESLRAQLAEKIQENESLRANITGGN